MRCTNCGHEAREPTRFCARCGRPLVTTQAPPREPLARTTPRWVRRALPYVVTIALAGGVSWFVSHRTATRSEARGSTQPGDAGGTAGEVPATDPLSGVRGIADAAPRAYAPGDCITWSEEGNAAAGDTRTVTCREPHLLEVSASLDLSGRFDTYPTATDWDSVLAGDCRPSVDALLGQPLDPFGKFAIFGVFPTRDSWAFGERTVWCGLTGRDASLALRAVPLTEEARNATQALIAPVGTCIGARSEWVPCTDSHLREVTGHAAVTGTAPPDAGDDRAWQALLGTRCEDFARAYLGRPLGADDLVGWQPIDPRSWVAGRRTVECLIARGAAGRAIEITGSLRAG